jgi:hypothetical protein
MILYYWNKHTQNEYVSLETVRFIITLSVCNLIWGRCNLKRSRRTVIVCPACKISSLKITPPKTPNSGQFSYQLPNIVSFLFRLEFRFRSRGFFVKLFSAWQPYCWRFWSAIVVNIHTSSVSGCTCLILNYILTT